MPKDDNEIEIRVRVRLTDRGTFLPAAVTHAHGVEVRVPVTDAALVAAWGERDLWLDASELARAVEEQIVRPHAQQELDERLDQQAERMREARRRALEKLGGGSR